MKKKSNVKSNLKSRSLITALLVVLMVVLGLGIYKDNQLKKQNEALKAEYEKSLLEPYAIITVKQDGSGDFTSLNKAIASIEDANKYKKYIVEIYEGEYDICSEFTEEEINNASYYPELGFVGLNITDGIYLKGIGDKEKIILKGELPLSYGRDRREAISTLNLLGNCGLENLTVTSKYIRYPVHDDFTENINATHEIKDCIFINYANSDDDGKNAAYGLGTKSGMVVNFENSKFYGNLAYHNNINFARPSVVNIDDSEVYGNISLWHFKSSIDCELNIYNTTYSDISSTYNEIDENTIKVNYIENND